MAGAGASHSAGRKNRNRSVSAAALPSPKNQSDDKNHQKNKREDFGNPCGGTGDSARAEYSSKDSNNEKNECVS